MTTNLLATIFITLTTNWTTLVIYHTSCLIYGCTDRHEPVANQIGSVTSNTIARIELDDGPVFVTLKTVKIESITRMSQVEIVKPSGRALISAFTNLPSTVQSYPVITQLNSMFSNHNKD
jgi:hypothetical protein